VVHRDIKPENILLEAGIAVVADFGIAKAVTAAGGEKLTETGMAVGTPTYMSPEQASGSRDLDGRSDLYSLGCVLYEMLAGVPPFVGPTAESVVHQHITARAPSVTVIREQVPREVAEVVGRALAKTPADRFATAVQFAEALAVVEAAPRTTPAPVAVTAKPKRNLIAYAAIAILAVIGAYTVISRTVGPPESATAAEPPRLAVLPFDNLGSPEDEYFADGITEEISSRIGEISGLRVISRQSTIQYKNSDKTLQQIGEELSVEYVLEGTIRTDRSPDGSGQVRVIPLLIRVSDDAQLWTDRYTADLVVGEIFRLQAEIAEQVADALNVTLLEPERRRLAAKPTDDLAAWEYYLRGNFYYNRSSRLEDNLAAADMYERAIARDSAFAIAWAGVAWAYGAAYQGSGAAEHLTKARAAVDRAFDLEPNLPEAHEALAVYQYMQGQYEQALEGFSKALRGRPNDAGAWEWMGLAQRRLGRWEEATDALTRAVELNPAAANAVGNLARTHLRMREYDEADRYYQQQLSLVPDLVGPHTDRAWVAIVGDGSVERAQQILHQAVQRFGLAQVLRALVQRWAGHRIWFSLPDWRFRQDLEDFTVATLGADSVAYYLARAASEHAEADTVRATAYYDSLRVVLESRVPLNSNQHGHLGIAYAGIGRKEDAVREALRGVELRPVSSDAHAGPWSLMYLARTYILVGEYDKAIEVLDTVVNIPSIYSRALLRVNTLFDPLRDRPRFQALLEERN
jgi:serine/threonine-protein kinase